MTSYLLPAVITVIAKYLLILLVPVRELPGEVYNNLRKTLDSGFFNLFEAFRHDVSLCPGRNWLHPRMML